MTILELDFHSTNSLVAPSKFYPADINVPHHQLRNFISTTYEDKILYVHNFDIFVIDLPKQQRSLVATVPFEARCLTANHGWVAVGGEVKGNCAFIRIGEGDSIFRQYGYDLIVDTLGKEIVNSMTIHRIQGVNANRQDQTVVLISNNDKTVTLYSLSQQKVLCVLPHPVPMNYASMSPDCTIIAAVGDSNEAYFYQRQDVASSDTNDRSITGYQEYQWRPFAVPQIPSGEGVLDDFSFAVAFSPSGEFCAVSAQGGAISVFDMKQLVYSENNSDAEKAILCTFRSSRACILGCVRSLSFSPEPWDLLAWTEDHGNIGVADIRSFVRRQSIPLNRDAAEVIEVENVTSSEYQNMNVKERLKHQYMHRMRALRGHPPVGARSLEELRNSQAGSESLDLDARERSVLDALETTIDDVEHHYSLRPYSVNYTSSTNATPSAASSELRREYDVHLLNPASRAQESYAPRRRHSVVLSETVPGRHLPPPETNRALMTASPAQMSEDNSTPPMSTNDLTPSNNSSSQPLPYNIPPSDPWHVIEAQLIADREAERRGGAATMFTNPPASLAQIEAAIYAERQFQTRLEQQLTDERRLSLLLRQELEARERLLEARQQELESERTRESRPSPSLERVLQTQLQTEQEQGRQRSNEIENEIFSNRQRVERLMEEREALLLRAMDSQERINLTATLGGLPPASTQSDDSSDLDTVLRQIEEERQTRRQRITDLELQVRRAESRVEIASIQGGSEPNRDRGDRISDARFLAGSARPAYTPTTVRRAQQMDQYGVPFGSRATPSFASPHSSRLRAAVARRAEAAASESRSALPRSSELAGRVSENDMRLARSMLHAAVIDANGNWVAGQAIRRNPAQLSRVTGVGSVQARALAVEDVLRDTGFGTAGIGWSPDGTYLYAGSEMGIFEFKVNLQDRMQFPSLEMR